MSEVPVHHLNQPSLIPSIAASIAAGTLLYPLDYYKTIAQLTYGSARLQIPAQPKYFFSGLGAMNASVFFKASTRFGTFNYFNKLFNASNSQSNPGILVSSLFAGITESLVIVPFENIKINLILSSLYNSLHTNNPFGIPNTVLTGTAGINAIAKHAKKATPHNNNIFATPASKSEKLAKKAPAIPQFLSKNSIEAAKRVYQQNGVYGFLKGTNMTLVRQCANSICFFGTYNSLKQLVDPKNSNDSNLIRFGLSFATSLVIVLVTQPIDLIKSRFQSDLYAKATYKNSLDCAYKVYVKEGWAKMYSGALPRLVKVSITGPVMLVFFSYFEKFM